MYYGQDMIDQVKQRNGLRYHVAKIFDNSVFFLRENHLTNYAIVALLLFYLSWPFSCAWLFTDTMQPD